MGVHREGAKGTENERRFLADPIVVAHRAGQAVGPISAAHRAIGTSACRMRFAYPAYSYFASSR